MLRNSVTTMLRKSRADFFLTIISEARGNSKLVWDQLKKLIGQEPNSRKPFELTVDGKSIRNPTEVAASSNQYFVDSVATIAQSFPPVNVEMYKTVIRTQSCLYICY